MKYFFFIVALTSFYSFAEERSIMFDYSEEQLESILPEEPVKQKEAEILESKRNWTPSREDIDEAILHYPLVITVDKAQTGPDAQRLQMWENGKLIFNVKASTGREKEEVAKSKRKYFSETPTGFFRPTRLFKKYESMAWQTSIPNPVFFDGGTALHGTTWDHFAKLGSRDSGGCVRMHPSNAKFVQEKVMSMGKGINDFEINTKEDGKSLKIDKNWVWVNNVSRINGQETKKKIASWNVVIVIYDSSVF